eukprot:CAMPEP_0206442190 /NCGR_PEP_ID=MMETSP0324_2-20121206/13687_1 /ASSEMBLY_ACC=CAM_ASM_000836 /TAXON_ID=2866 /ORGANISM="Crypthecodinium cohnii, Strain Seligo" /LENGTH=676 /DNA_ID=CAMNT_0053910011 /DNA_START=114 /DNA_END=2144 /DNA_ORIENTATION=+
MSKLFLVLGLTCSSFQEGSGLARVSRSENTIEVDKNRPVSKVITLLKDMLKQLEKEATEDEEIYDKLACWCQTNDKEKTKAIATAEARISDLTTKIEDYTASSAQLNTEIKNLEKEVAENQASLDQATALRQKELAEFNAEEKESLEAISALKAAITVLSKHNSPSSLLQLDQRSVASIKSASKKVLSAEQQRSVLAYLKAPSGGFMDAAPTFKQSYAPQSGEIFGILSQMKDTFEANLASSQKEEQANQKAFEELKAAKIEEIKSGQDQVDSKTLTLADTDEKNAQAKEDQKDTTASLNADEQFLGMLKEKCSMTDKEWEERQKTRSMEMEAVSKALEVLSGDEAHDLFTRTFNPSLLQVSSSEVQTARSKAATLLESVARKSGAPALSALAMRVKLDAFERVKKAIDDMVEQLAKEQADEVKHKDFCVDEFNTNKLQTEEKTRQKIDTKTSIKDLKSTIGALTAAIETLKADVAETQVQMKRAGEDRELSNKEFQTTVADQRATQKLLKAALSVLEDFYGKEKKSFVQAEPVGPPPAGFEEYKKNESAGGVTGLLKQIMADAKAMEAEAIRSEEDAQKAYEDFVKDSNAAIEAKSKDIVNKSEEKAKAEGALSEASKSLEAIATELEQLANSKAQLHQSCDFVLKNFDLRQQARSDEIEALKQAKAILSGAKFD